MISTSTSLNVTSRSRMQERRRRASAAENRTIRGGLRRDTTRHGNSFWRASPHVRHNFKKGNKKGHRSRYERHVIKKYRRLFGQVLDHHLPSPISDFADRSPSSMHTIINQLARMGWLIVSSDSIEYAIIYLHVYLNKIYFNIFLCFNPCQLLKII